MTELRQSAIIELEKIPEDKLSFVIQIITKKGKRLLQDWNSYVKKGRLSMMMQN